MKNYGTKKFPLFYKSVQKSPAFKIYLKKPITKNFVHFLLYIS